MNHLYIYTHISFLKKYTYLDVHITLLTKYTEKKWCRESAMREVNEKTNKRVAQLSFVSLGLCLIVSLFQVWHLKRFFLKKKLI